MQQTSKFASMKRLAPRLARRRASSRHQALLTPRHLRKIILLSFSAFIILFGTVTLAGMASDSSPAKEAQLSVTSRIIISANPNISP